jgi:hypothetical protein
MDFKEARVATHNNWPKRIYFKAEELFKDKLDRNQGRIPFQPIVLNSDDDPEYQRFVGHLIDGLEALPFRPDYLFDHCFRIIDCGADQFFPKKGIKGIVQGLASLLLKESRHDWVMIIDALCTEMPLHTRQYLVKRMCSAYSDTDDDSKLVKERISECIGTSFYGAFVDKFCSDGKGNLARIPSGVSNINATKFLKLYLSGKTGTRTKKASHIPLDLTKDKNVPSENRRIEFLLSILLFTMRNERAHGEVLSPFRTSKASIERYESYYYSMLTAYIFALGVMQLRKFGGVNGASILQCCQANLNLQKAFFSAA